MPRNNENSIPVVKFAIEGYVAAETRHGVTGELVDRVENHNLVVNLGLSDIAKLVSNTTVTIGPWSIGNAAIGTGSATPDPDDTSLTNAVFSSVSKAYTAATDAASDQAQVQYTFSYATNEAGTATYTEVGLCKDNTATFSTTGEQASQNVLFSRATHGAISKSTDVTLSYTYDLFFKTSS